MSCAAGSKIVVGFKSTYIPSSNAVANDLVMSPNLFRLLALVFGLLRPSDWEHWKDTNTEGGIQEDQIFSSSVYIGTGPESAIDWERISFKRCEEIMQQEEKRSEQRSLLRSFFN